VSPRPERLTVRPLTAGDDLEPDVDLAQRVFGPLDEAEREQRRAASRLTAASGRYFGAFDGGTMVASARYLDLRQWWHGRVLPAAGVAGVKVAPHEQGRGLGRALMTALLEQAAGRGYPLAVLYPATTPLYRSLGWEMAGGRYEAAIPARSLRSLVPPDPLLPPGPLLPSDPLVASDPLLPSDPVPAPELLLPPGSAPPGGAAPPPGPGVAGRPPAAAGPGADAGRAGRPDRDPVFRPAGAADAAAMIDVLSGLYAAGTDCGPVTFEAPQLAATLGDQDYLYLARDGALSYRWDRARDEMFVSCAAAGSAATARALWSIVSSHGTIVSGVRAVVSPADPVTWLTAEPDVTLTRAEQWMLRLLDAPAAIAGRGFPPGVSLSVPLAVSDPQLPANAGDWQLEVSDARAALTRARPGAGAPLRLGARGLAALYAGTPLATLRRVGLAAGGTPAADAALNAAFAATPYMTDSF
jgi:predicted acetyltransferase